MRVLLITVLTLVAYVPVASPVIDSPTGWVRVVGDAGTREAVASTTPASIGLCVMSPLPSGECNCDMAVPEGTYAINLTRQGTTFNPSNISVTITAGVYQTVHFLTTSFPTPSPTSSPTPVPTVTPAPVTPTPTPTPTVVPTATPTPTSTPTPVVSPTPSPVVTPTPAPTATPTPSPTSLPVCKPNQFVGNPPTCRCLTGMKGASGKCR